MARNAIGLIETVGLVGAIEAADAAAKAAAVTLTKAEVTPGALVSIHMEGELGAVQAAVEAGVAACQKVGRLLSYVIIPRPDDGLDVILDEPSNLYVPTGPYCAIALKPPEETPETPTGSDDNPTSKAKRPRRTKRPSSGDYDSMTVQALRRLARRRTDLTIAGRDIARADRETLLRHLREADQRDQG
ncbi:MAG: BMC domain-containing protein [candidate division Zixibacteria bacterium]|nr:BMC domain-containing protein [candidate division Zixibacteria bacterium]